MRDFWRAIKYGSVNKKLTFLAVFFSFLYPIIDLLQPLVLKNLFDLVETSIKTGSYLSLMNGFYINVGLYALLLTLDMMNSQVGSWYFTKWWNFTRQKLMTDVFGHLESLSLKYFETNTTGKIKERVDKGINDLNSILDTVLMELGPQIFFILASIIILLYVNIWFGILILVGTPLFMIISLKYFPIMAKVQDLRRNSDEKASGMVTEAILNIKTIKSYVTEDRHRIRLFKQLQKSSNLSQEYQRTRIVMNIYRYIVMNFIQIGILGLGVYWTLTGKISLGTLTLAWQYTNRSVQPLWWMMRQIDNIQRDMRSVRRVFELIDEKPEVVDTENSKSLKVRFGHINFNDVTFAYKDRKVLRRLNLDIPGGKTLAIVGKSGSGKSTLVKLLSRFYNLDAGSILIDRQNIFGVTQKSLRKNIGVVSQDSILFNDTAANNISYGKPGAKHDEIVAAAIAANAHEFITKLPNGYKTIVGERGVKLSGGEQQRINIARAILKNPPILVLDEATSSLDSESEHLIQEALWKLIDGRTAIIIAHRLSTVMKADLIVVMDKGKIVETGTHKDLVNQKGIYSRLFEIQSGGYLK